MARRRVAEQLVTPAEAVPPELLDHGAPVWVDGDLFVAWTRKYVGRRVEVSETGSCSRFRATADAWARSVGLVDPVYPEAVDAIRLRELGIRPCRRLRAEVV